MVTFPVSPAAQRLQVRVLKKSVNGLEVSILPEGVQASLPTMHLSDHVSNCSLLWESLKEGDTISDIVCFSKNRQYIVSCFQTWRMFCVNVRVFDAICNQTTLTVPVKNLTKKPTVRWSLEEGEVAKDFSDITVGMQLTGWIKNVMSYGVFVAFPYGLVGLAPKSVSPLHKTALCESRVNIRPLKSFPSVGSGHDRQIHQRHGDGLPAGPDGDRKGHQPG